MFGQVAYGVIKEPAPCGPGPWGGDGGRAWDDGVFSGISQIHLTREAEGICSVQIEYDRNGQFIWSAKHGGNGGTSPHRVRMLYQHLNKFFCFFFFFRDIINNYNLRIYRNEI